MLSIGKNIAALLARRQLDRSSADLSRTFERLASGQRINRASDDPAGLALAESLKSSTRVNQQGVRNLNDGINLLSVADGALEALQSITSRLQELAQQAANGTYSGRQRLALDKEAQALSDEYTRIARSTEFNGRKLFDKDFGTLSLQAGFGTSGVLSSGLGGGIGDGTFGARVSYAVGSRPYAVATGDLNNDGNIDVISANESGSVSILLGHGNGTFSSPISLASAGSPTSVRTGDFNGDGNLDLATAAFAGDQISLYLGRGDGTFTAQQVYTGSVDPLFMTAADVNNDGRTDVIASSDGTNSIEIYLGQSDGTLVQTTSLGMGIGINETAVGDLNSDGIMDIAVTDPSTGGAYVFLGSGNAQFSAGVTYNMGGSAARHINLADLNNDGTLDLVTPNSAGTGTVSVRLGRGDGTFGALQTSTIGPLSLGSTIADFNSDGLLDIATTNHIADSLAISMGNGDGTFRAAQTLVSGDQPQDIAAADFNNDGVLDLVSADYISNQIGIYLANRFDGVAVLQQFSLQGQLEAKNALTYFNSNSNLLLQQRSTIGSFRNRAEIARSHLQSTSDAYTQAYSRIVDLDVAEEVTKMVRLQILQQAATSILAQANQNSQLVLKLLSDL